MLVTLANLAGAAGERADQHADSDSGHAARKIGPRIRRRSRFMQAVALARIMMPTSFVRLSPDVPAMTDETQALCFFAGANSIFVGDTLLTAADPETRWIGHFSIAWASRRSKA